MKEKTRLLQIAEQKAEQIRNAIEQAIDEGARIVMCNSIIGSLNSCRIDDLYVQKENKTGIISVVLNFSSVKIAKLFEPSKEELKKMAEQKRAELAEIEKQINFLNEYETDNN